MRCSWNISATNVSDHCGTFLLAPAVCHMPQKVSLISENVHQGSALHFSAINVLRHHFYACWISGGTCVARAPPVWIGRGLCCSGGAVGELSSQTHAWRSRNLKIWRQNEYSKRTTVLDGTQPGNRSEQRLTPFPDFPHANAVRGLGRAMFCYDSVSSSSV